MSRPKKDYQMLNMKVDSVVMHRFSDYCETVGQTKTLAFERIITAFLDHYDTKKGENIEIEWLHNKKGDNAI